MTAEEVVQALAAVPYADVRVGHCHLCRAWLERDGHAPACPWVRAVEWVAEQGSPKRRYEVTLSRFLGIVGSGPKLFAAPACAFNYPHEVAMVGETWRCENCSLSIEPSAEELALVREMRALGVATHRLRADPCRVPIVDGSSVMYVECRKPLPCSDHPEPTKEAS